MGYCISIKHGTDTYTIYRNLGETPAEGIAEGVSVRAGQLIGFVGESAMIEVAQGPHLHLEMIVAGVQVNPLDYFDQASIASLNVNKVYEG
jgi:murein DD-endopeptidase MepM/ murein hydrolase activator NlpD